jgi:6-phosphogluconolactonase
MADAALLRQRALQRVALAAEQAILERGAFHVVLAGGNTPRGIYEVLCGAKTDWASWHVWFGDERCLPPLDAERNSRMADDSLLSHVPIPPSQIHIIPAELGAERAAVAYASALREVSGREFDLVLLGLGEDGHTASLFPGHDWGVAGDSSDAQAVLDAPKPPPERVSLSAARLSRARQVLFLVTGESKREAVSAWRAGRNIPAAAITPLSGVDVLIEAALLLV